MDSIGITGVLNWTDTKKDLVKRYGKADPFLYTRYRKMASSHPKNKRSAKTVIVTKIGKPKNAYYSEESSLCVYFGKNREVQMVSIRSPKFSTKNGISVGDSRDKIIEVHGFNDSAIIKLPQKGIDFVFDDDEIIEIRLYKKTEL